MYNAVMREAQERLSKGLPDSLPFHNKKESVLLLEFPIEHRRP